MPDPRLVVWETKRLPLCNIPTPPKTRISPNDKKWYIGQLRAAIGLDTKFDNSKGTTETNNNDDTPFQSSPNCIPVTLIRSEMDLTNQKGDGNCLFQALLDSIDDKETPSASL